MTQTLSGVASSAQPWARSVESRLDTLNNTLGIVQTAVGDIAALDKTVFAEGTFDPGLGQAIAHGTNGQVAPNVAIAGQFLSSTGLYEVTVSVAGLISDGAIFGAGAVRDNAPLGVDSNIATRAYMTSAPVGSTAFMPFGGSYSVVINTRAGIQKWAVAYYANCTAGTNGSVWIKRCSLSIKAV